MTSALSNREGLPLDHGPQCPLILKYQSKELSLLFRGCLFFSSCFPSYRSKFARAWPPPSDDVTTAYLAQPLLCSFRLDPVCFYHIFCLLNINAIFSVLASRTFVSDYRRTWNAAINQATRLYVLKSVKCIVRLALFTFNLVVMSIQGASVADDVYRLDVCPEVSN